MRSSDIAYAWMYRPLSPNRSCEIPSKALLLMLLAALIEGERQGVVRRTCSMYCPPMVYSLSIT